MTTSFASATAQQMLTSARITNKVLVEVEFERIRQDEQWGLMPRHLDPHQWMTILTEEVGEAAKGVLDLNGEQDRYRELRQELIQVAAVAVAFVEDLDWRYKNPK